MMFGSGAEPGLIRQVLSVLAVFILLGAALWKLGHVRNFFAITRRLKASRPTRTLETTERLSLTPHHMLHLVRVNHEEILVATYPNGCHVLGGGMELPVARALRDRTPADIRAHVI